MCVCVYMLSRVQLFVAPWTIQPTRLLCPLDFPSKNTGVGCHCLFQGIFPTQGSDLFLESPALQLDSLPLVPPGKPKYSINMWLNIVKYSIF